MQGARDEEVLLRKSQAFSDLWLVVGVEHLAQGLGEGLLRHRPVVVADVKILEVERFDRLGFPQAQRVASVDPVTQDGRVVGHALHLVSLYPANRVTPLRVGVPLAVAAELDVERDLRPHELPGVSTLEPLVGDLHLPAVLDRLIEDAELISDTVTNGRHLESRQRIEEAGGEPSKAAVPEAGLLFVRHQFFEIHTERMCRGTHLRLDPEIHEVVTELRPHQKLSRQVTGDLDVALEALRGAHPALHKPVANGVGERHVPVVRRGERRKTPLQGGQIVEERALEGRRIEAGPGRCVRLHLRCTVPSFPLRFRHASSLVFHFMKRTFTSAASSRTPDPWRTRPSPALQSGPRRRSSARPAPVARLHDSRE